MCIWNLFQFLVICITVKTKDCNRLDYLVCVYFVCILQASLIRITTCACCTVTVVTAILRWETWRTAPKIVTQRWRSTRPPSSRSSDGLLPTKLWKSTYGDVSCFCVGLYLTALQDVRVCSHGANEKAEAISSLVFSWQTGRFKVPTSLLLSCSISLGSVVTLQVRLSSRFN